jgi:hypothetical protein
MCSIATVQTIHQEIFLARIPTNPIQETICGAMHLEIKAAIFSKTTIPVETTFGITMEATATTATITTAAGTICGTTIIIQITT